MIRINLIRTGALKRKTASFSLSALAKPLLAVLIVAVVALSGFGVLRWLKNRPVRETVVAVKEHWGKKEKAPEPAPSAGTPAATGFEPSTHVAQKMVEEVVADVETEHRKGAASVLDGLSYREMSRG
ncbi:MAG: hypothetical protein JXA71_15160, partial [Chitinispirillaceae bacterium]|nr:hypothetical protein [Chitinispirillaceae bacterium]